LSKTIFLSWKDKHGPFWTIWEGLEWTPGKTNFFGNSLDILLSGRIPVGSVNLIYLDPPINSNATYNILFAERSGEKSAARITA
jgi:hypothetical protein